MKHALNSNLISLHLQYLKILAGLSSALKRQLSLVICYFTSSLFAQFRLTYFHLAFFSSQAFTQLLTSCLCILVTIFLDLTWLTIIVLIHADQLLLSFCYLDFWHAYAFTFFISQLQKTHLSGQPYLAAKYLG